MIINRRSFLAASALGAFSSVVPSLTPKAWAQAKQVRVANGTTLDILSLPDVRTFEVFLPKEGAYQTSVTYVPGAVRAIQAVLVGEAEVGISTLGSGLAAVLQNQDIRVFCLASGARPYLVPVAAKGITSLKQLEGQEVGVISLVDSTYYLLVMMMRSQGADPTKVQWRVVGGGAGRANAMISGAVKAAMFQVGQALDLMEKGSFDLVPAPFDGLKNTIFKAFWAKRDFLEKNPETADAIVRAHLLSTREALNKQQFMSYAPPPLAPMTPDVISRSYDILLKTGPWDPNDALLNKTAGDETVADMVRYGVISGPVDFDKWAVTGHVARAVAKLGTV
ncbi:ABC transporter substrate-binding protein [Ferrovibrio sp. MS7]|jgi:ABC-type nitrate/sulfonate/bicarbonate transport system substrate-binding protein|uniref:ABC transporter substrate-binding protein n=1 Tax=Ferrovibrio plantarum TaxID=3119164 RepID=UPI003135503C